MEERLAAALTAVWTFLRLFLSVLLGALMPQPLLKPVC